MTAKELKKLSRADLLEMLLAVSKENAELRQQLEQAQAQLQNRMVKIENSGSLAEAALQLNGIFEAAQAACQQYQENIRQRCDLMEQETRQRCEAMLAEVEQQAGRYDWLADMIGETK